MLNPNPNVREQASRARNLSHEVAKLRDAIAVGVVPALLEGVLIKAFDPGIDGWYFAQAVSFWFTCGFVVHLAIGGRPRRRHAVLLTVLLNVPWLIEEAIRPGRYDHLLPLLVASVIAGVVIGLVSKRLTPASAQPPQPMQARRS